jgi:thiol-disulfide isomerase/thioredoxin
MGGLSALRARGGALFAAGISALVLVACDDLTGKEPVPAPPTTSRSNAVLAGGSATAAAPVKTAASASAAPSVAAAPRKLCAGQTPRPAPKGSVETAAAPGAQALSKSVPFGVGKWVWVNFWAAWCKPCKEEMPRLIEWQKKLSGEGVLLELAFVSIDDDQRQLQRFLEEQPAAGVRASYWLPEGGGRTSWLGALGLKDPPDLPAHAFVAPSGQVSCVFQGAVEERDYPQLAALFSGKP